MAIPITRPDVPALRRDVAVARGVQAAAPRRIRLARAVRRRVGPCRRPGADRHAHTGPRARPCVLLGPGAPAPLYRRHAHFGHVGHDSIRARRKSPRLPPLARTAGRAEARTDFSRARATSSIVRSRSSTSTSSTGSCVSVRSWSVLRTSVTEVDAIVRRLYPGLATRAAVSRSLDRGSPSPETPRRGPSDVAAFESLTPCR